MRPQLRAALLFLLVMCFGVLIFGGYLIKRDKPPIPKMVTSDTGTVLFTGADIAAGQNYYFSRGGQHMGSVWGDGSYLAPDWSADYLHRLGLFTGGPQPGTRCRKGKGLHAEGF